MDGVIGITNFHSSVLWINTRKLIKKGLELKQDLNNRNPQVKNPFNSTRKDPFRGGMDTDIRKQLLPQYRI